MAHTQSRIWLNKNISSTYSVLKQFRADVDSKRFYLICSHSDEHNPVRLIADHFEQEPLDCDNSEEKYVAYCLDFVRRHNVSLFLPGRRTKALARAEYKFAELGCKLLLVASDLNLALLDNKVSFYRSLSLGLANIPLFASVTDIAGFNAEFDRLTALGKGVCFKPAVGIYGSGFHFISADGNALDRLLDGDTTALSIDEARFYLSKAERFRELIVMEYLPGDEHSVDCLAQNGRLLAAVSRLKSELPYQLIEENDSILEQVQALTSYLCLNGIFNVQFKDNADGVPYLLEINTRMSGGLPMAGLAGVNFLYWAVRIALEPTTVESIPSPIIGLRVRDVGRATLV